MATLTKALADAAVYFGDNGRAMCSEIRCAGVTAATSGRDLSGQRVVRATTDDVTEWGTYDLGALSCECGAVTLSPVAGSDGFPLAR